MPMLALKLKQLIEWCVRLARTGQTLLRTLVLAALAVLVVSAGQLGAVDNVDEPHVWMRKYCYDCHNGKKQKGDLNLEKLASTSVSAADDHVWDSVRRALAEQEMPPSEKPQPSVAERDAGIAWIDRKLDGPNGDTPTDPGNVTIHRLTLTEFNRTISDLLGVDGNPADVFPADNSGGSGTFDNNADTLFVSPMLLERLIDVSLAIVGQAKPERLFLVEPVKDRKGQVTFAAKKKALEASLAIFLPIAWRRPVTLMEIQKLSAIYEKAGKKLNIIHEEAVKLIYCSALTSPNFLYRIEETKFGKYPTPLNPYEYATRLSYFLWSTMPDAALTAAAKDGKLKEPADIAAQVKRMLADPKASILASQFMGQWLGTDNLIAGLGPDIKFIRGYDESLRAAMIKEPVVLMQALLDKNGSLADLIDCNYVYVNAELARHYGLSGPSGSKFERVAVDDGRRGGLVTMAGVLAITSRPARTSPVIRGKWILTELLSYPPPPPPPNVPELKEVKVGAADVGTLRQRLERHRADPTCNSCHQRIDPLGFGLENFDAIGRWRTVGDLKEPLDTVGTMPSGEKFDGPQQLKKLLLQRKERIMTTVVERMLSYALGRPIERCDRSTVRLIVKNLGATDWKAQSLITEVALSLPFCFKRPISQLKTDKDAVKDKDSKP